MSTSENEISYREFVQRCVKEQQPSADDYEALENYRAYLKLSPERARAIEQEILGTQIIPPQSSSNLSPETNSVNQRVLEPDNPPSANHSNNNSVPAPLSVGLTPTPSIGPPPIDQAIEHTTQLLPKQPENYFAHLEQYGKEFLQALRTEGFNLSEETRERLRKLAKQFELLGTDVADIERKMLVELYLTTGQREAVSPPITVPDPPIEPEEKYNADLEPFFLELKGSLKAGDLKVADIATCKILLKVIDPSLGWFDEASLRDFKPETADKKAIQEIDRLWREYSKDRFGFKRQLQLYGINHVATQEADLDKQQRANRTYTLLFSKQVQWWLKGLEFFKFYNQLDFSMEAPDGHLPARWFWEIPRPKAFQYGGLGLLPERGGCGVDSFVIPAFMYMIRNAGIQP